MHLTLIMLKQLAKDLSGRDELWRRKLLVADHQHMMLDKGAVQYGRGSSVNILVQINPTHFGAGVRGQWTDRVHHRAISSILAYCAPQVWRQPLLLRNPWLAGQADAAKHGCWSGSQLVSITCRGDVRRRSPAMKTMPSGGRDACGVPDCLVLPGWLEGLS